ncbi:NUDIX hydrolase [Sulfuracidifex metallicus]|uniref:NUDIX hydrolase n=1 Tax=Sulfuracidifex metallicus TaxID=47303 RepID=UPI002274BF68|nr:NUDIX hydrolase [Sulfuracidifex metallicus]MCY0849351.1 NUDIX hydrolase [Sulfuracidifex metallicus]
MKIYNGRKFSLEVEKVTLPNGFERELEIIKHRGSAAILPLIGEDEIILIKQYRPVIGKYIFEIPAGSVEDGEDVFTTARRELEEEIGYQAEELDEVLSFYPSPGITNEEMHLFLAKGLRYVGAKPEPYEIIEPIKVKIQDALAMVERRDIVDAKTIIAIYFIARKQT